MTDYALSAPDQATMYAAFDALGIRNADGEITTQGLFEDGTEWAIVDQGARYYPDGSLDADGNPVMVTDGLYWVPMRWNGGAPLPPDQPGITVEWQSDAEPPTEYPIGVVRFA
jgi:hypothetical protein